MPLDREVVLLALILLGIPDALAFGLQEMALHDTEHVIRGQIKGQVISLHGGRFHRG